MILILIAFDNSGYIENIFTDDIWNIYFIVNANDESEHLKPGFDNNSIANFTLWTLLRMPLWERYS